MVRELIKIKVDFDNLEAEKGFEIVKKFLDSAEEYMGDTEIHPRHEDEGGGSFLLIDKWYHNEFFKAFNSWFRSNYEFISEIEDNWLDIINDRISADMTGDYYISKLTDDNYDYSDGSYSICQRCNSAFLSGDSLGSLGNYWTPENGSGIVCHHCLNSDLELAEEYLKDKEGINNPKWADQALEYKTLKKMGFENMNSYRHQMSFDTQCEDEPTKILSKYQAEDLRDNPEIKYEYLFQITSRHMFGTNFVLYRREVEQED